MWSDITPRRLQSLGTAAGHSFLADIAKKPGITLLQARGVALSSAVSYGALIGPAQVGARVVEMALKGRDHPLWTLSAAFGLIAIGLAFLTGGLPGVGVWLVLYGGGNGIYSIARVTVPLALFGPQRYPLLVGHLARLV